MIAHLEETLEEALLVVDMKQSISRVDDIIVPRSKIHGQAICDLKRYLHSQHAGREGKSLIVQSPVQTFGIANPQRSH